VITLYPAIDARVVKTDPSTPYGVTNVTLSTFWSSDSTNIQHTLVQFDLSSLGAGATITSASFSLTTQDYVFGSAGLPMSVYRITRPWTEAEATWNQYAAGSAWSNPGGDYVGTTGVQNTNPYATITPNIPINTIMPVTWDVTQLAQQWYTGLYSNYGLLASAAPNSQVIYYDRTSTTASYRPQLTLTYTTASAQTPEPGTLALLAAGGAMLLRRRRARG
jgi:hypothetical protein